MTAIFALIACIHFDAPGWAYLVGFLCVALDH